MYKVLNAVLWRYKGHNTPHTQNFLYGDIYVLCAYDQILYSYSAVPSTQCPLFEISGCVRYSF